MINTDQLEHHPENPRKDLGDLTELVESMKKNGVMQNLTVIIMVGKDKDYNADVPVEPFEENPNGSKGEHRYFVLIGNRRLELYGFGWSDDELRQIADGTHELYEKRDPDDHPEDDYDDDDTDDGDDE